MGGMDVALGRAVELGTIVEVWGAIGVDVRGATGVGVRGATGVGVRDGTGVGK